MARLRLSGLSSPRSGATLSLASAGTTATWSSDPGFPTIAAPDYLVCTASPGTAQEEIFYVTAHTAAATSSTVVRNAEPTQSGQNSTAAQSTVGWVHAPTPADFSSLSSVPAYNMLPANFQLWRKAVANVRDNNASVKLLCIGTSLTQGGGVAGAIGTQGWPALLAQNLNKYVVPAQGTLGILQPYTGTYDNRFSIGSGWTIESLGAGFGWANVGYVTGVVGAAGSLTFTPPSTEEIDTFDIWYAGSSVAGVMQAKVDSGSDNAINTYNATNGYYKQTVTCTRGTGHVLTMHTITTNNVYITAVDAYDSTVKSVHVGNCGVDGLGTAGGFAASQPIMAMQAYAPDLTIIELGADDAIEGTPPSVSAFLANVATVVAAAKTTGDVVLLAGHLPNPAGAYGAPAVALFASYIVAIYSYAAANNIGLIDVTSRFGPWATWNADGFDSGDGTHPSALGNADYAAAISRALASVV